MEPLIFVGVSLTAIAVFVGLDLTSSEMRRRLCIDPFHRRRNLVYIVANVVTMVILAQVNGWLATVVPALPGLTTLWASLPFVVEAVLCFLVAEAINWLSHWIKHVHPWLWTFHLQHHVGRHYDTTLTLHTHGLDVVVSGAVMSTVLLLLGFSKLSVDIFVLTYFVANLYKHHHRQLSLGPVLDKLIVGPAFHRVHHHRQARGNYGSVLTIFDVALKTVVWPDPTTVWEDPVGVDGLPERGCVDELLAPWSASSSGVIDGSGPRL